MVNLGKICFNATKMAYAILLIIYLIPLSGNTQTRKIPNISGIVYDGQVGEKLSLANVYIEETQQQTRTDKQGAFSISLSAYEGDITLIISYIGKKTIKQKIAKSDLNKPIVVTLVDNSLTLEQIDVNPTFEGTKNSISSITFDEEAIERVQAFSLLDVLNNLPGRQISAPNINAPQTLTLRTTLDRSDALNNSLGVPIIMDGVALSNDANMQSRLPGQWGMMSGALPATNGGNTADVPFRGIDLREIPVESIEKIEVIQGVASAEFGELTDGAILIERKAGRSPWHFTTNINGGSQNYSLNKGFDLPKGWGGLMVDGNYAKSNSNLTDRFQEYRRYGMGIRWNTPQYRYFRNKLSIDFNQRLDEVKLDPDDDTQKSYESTESGIRISNNMVIKVDKPWLDDINFSASYSERNQESYAQVLLNRGGIPVGGKDTTGIYEGLLVSGRYMSEERIVGNPITASANLRFASRFRLGGSSHVLSYGANGNYANNGGRGIIADPLRPRWIDVSDQNVRPYSFELTPAIFNAGLYLTDNIRYRWLGKAINSSLGIRFDSQNGSLSVQPRLSTQIVLDKHWQVSAAYGIATKSPTLLHRYPPPTWIDIPLGNVSYGNTSLYLLHTERIELANANLKPSRSMQGELNINYRDKFISSRLNGYFKHNTNGFNSVKQFYPITLPQFAFDYDATAGKINYNETGEYVTYYDNSVNHIANVRSSYTYGFDWSLSTKKIKAIETSFLTSTSFILSRQDNGDILEDTRLAQPVVIDGQNIWYALYNPLNSQQRYILTSKLNSTTHIPKLGFVIMTYMDINWMNKMSSLHTAATQPAIAYLDATMQRVWLTPEQQAAGIIPGRDLSASSSEQRIVYANFSLSVAKEIGKKMRIAVTAYNTFNLRPQSSFINPTNGIEVITRYNSPLSITGGVSFKL